jgi:uncharacterized membrane protein
MSHRRLGIVASLFGLTLLVYAMVGVRVLYTGGTDYGELVWNLFLAWIPFVLALVVYDGYRRGAARWQLLAGSALWLLFLPNAPYILTDAKHLRISSDSMPIWYDVVLVSAAAFAGLVLGFLSLYMIQAVVRRLAGAVSAWLFALGVLGLSSFGVYLGRFHRWNSWDLFTQPGALLGDIGSGLAHPHDHARTLALMVVFTAFLGAIYFVFYSFVRAGIPESTDH